MFEFLRASGISPGFSPLLPFSLGFSIINEQEENRKREMEMGALMFAFFAAMAALTMAFLSLAIKVILGFFGLDVAIAFVFRWMLRYLIPCGLISLVAGGLFFKKKTNAKALIFLICAALETICLLVWFYKPSSPALIKPEEAAGAIVTDGARNLTVQADAEQARQFLAMLDQTPMRHCTEKTARPQLKFLGTELFFQNDQGEIILSVRIFNKTGLGVAKGDKDYRFYCVRGDAQIDIGRVYDFVQEHTVK